MPLAAYALLLLITVDRLQQEIIRTNLEDELEHTANSVQQVIQREISFFSGLAMVPATASDETGALEARAELARQLHPSTLAITLRDRERTIFDLGGALSGPVAGHGAKDEPPSVWSSAMPEIGDLTAGNIPLEIPILRDGRVAYVLTGVVDPRLFNDLLRSTISAKGWIAALLDRSLAIAARSKQGEVFVGTPATPDLAEAIRTGRTGVQRSITKDGRPSYVVTTALGETGWYLAMAIPVSVAEQTYRPVWLRFLANGGLILLAMVAAASLLVWWKVRRLEARTETLTSGLARANLESDEKSAFMAVISHELRTPLTGILGFSELLAKSPLAPVQKEWLKLQVSSGRILLNVINDILDYSKIEGGYVTLESVEFDVRHLVDRCIALVKPMAATKGIRLHCDFALDGVGQVKGDPTRLQQVIGNLLNNAVKFTEHGEVSLSVSLKPDGLNRAELRIGVRDTGIGIPVDRYHRLFKRFSQADNSTTRTYGGTGLGLAVCKALVEMMGGSIGFDSREGRGSNFHFAVLLPVTQSSPDDSDGARNVEERPRAGSRILVVEDNPITQTLTRTVLEQAGYGVSVAGSGEEAVTAVEQDAFDLVLMDVHLPGMDGPDATRAIRSKTGEHGRIPILALTADAFHDDVTNCLAAGMDGHVAKPFKIDDLLQAVAGHLRRPERPDMAETGQAGFPETDEAAIEAATRPRPGSIAAAVGKPQAAAMIRMFIGRVEITLDDLARGDRTPPELYEASHQMIGAAGMFGYTGIVAAARTLCLACRSERPDRIQAALSDLQAILREFLEQAADRRHSDPAEP
ncbi:response regulator [Azospirillum sp. YIM B02556]|uniref:histidine kinase n=1 Tax=Azospirillum endophyticum TaxID=2800326 RepID=A0ABS1FCJ7_9PROT|nr:ATP-binding protein [Azospirillum endophyticum]MBK1841153.1 response regulator [Azospirillum endophyticum]